MPVLGVTFGILMPLVSGLIYPTYTNYMPQPWLETTRLLEFPFVAAELVIIVWALATGMDSVRFWRSLSLDTRIALVVFLIGLFVSSILISANPPYSLLISLTTAVHLIFAVSLVHLLRKFGAGGRKLFLLLHGVGLIFLAIYTAWRFEFAPDPSLVPGGQIRWDNAIPGFISVRHLGSWTGAIAAAFAMRILFLRNGTGLNIYHFFYFISASFTIWSGTRTAILSMIVVLVIMVLSLRKLPELRHILIAIILTVLAFGAAWMVLPDHPAFLLYTASDTQSGHNMMSGRDELWAMTWDRWLESPIFGWGSGSTFWEVYIGWTHTQPHNAFLQFLISWGVVGACGALWLLAKAIRTAHESAVGIGDGIVYLAMLYSLLFQSMFEGMLHYPRFIISIVLLFVILIVTDQNEPENRSIRSA